MSSEDLLEAAKEANISVPEDADLEQLRAHLGEALQKDRHDKNKDQMQFCVLEAVQNALPELTIAELREITEEAKIPVPEGAGLEQLRGILYTYAQKAVEEV